MLNLQRCELHFKPNRTLWMTPLKASKCHMNCKCWAANSFPRSCFLLGTLQWLHPFMCGKTLQLRVKPRQAVSTPLLIRRGRRFGTTGCWSDSSWGQQPFSLLGGKSSHCSQSSLRGPGSTAAREHLGTHLLASLMRSCAFPSARGPHANAPWQKSGAQVTRQCQPSWGDLQHSHS